MREQIMQRMEGNDLLNRQLGVDRFPDDSESWWPANMRNDLRKARDSGVRVMQRKNRGRHAG